RFASVRRPRRSTRVPYTTLFRSEGLGRQPGSGHQHLAALALAQHRHHLAGAQLAAAEVGGEGVDVAPLGHRSSRGVLAAVTWSRSEEHTSELQSRENLVCRLLLE